MLTGQPPFDTVMVTKDVLISQMIDEIGPPPSRWVDQYEPPPDGAEPDDKVSLEEWLKGAVL